MSVGKQGFFSRMKRWEWRRIFSRQAVCPATLMSVLLIGWSAQAAPLVLISEFMADNSKTLADGDGDYSDWIELYNASNDAVSLNSWYLTDDLDELEKWRFPTSDSIQLTIQPGAYLIVFASGKGDSNTPYIDQLSDVHTCFKLSSGGGSLALVMDDGETIVHQYTDYPRQKQDISYGVDNSLEQTGYLSSASPGKVNGALLKGLVGDTQFSVDRGFYEEPFDLEITTKTEGPTIRYTLDGSDPSETNGLTYSAPLHIETTTVLRAAAFKDGYLSSNIDTQTYLFVQDIITQSSDGSAPNSSWPTAGTQSSSGPGGNQGNPGGNQGGRNPGGDSGATGSSQVMDYGMDPDVVNDARYQDLMDDALLAIPSMSIVTNLSNLFDTSTGIYMNAMQDGEDWERPVSLELIYPDGTKGFQIDAGLRIRGGVSRSSSNPKHNFRLLFRSDYGNAKLKYALFGDEGVDEFDKVDLRTAQNFSWQYSSAAEATWLYDVFARDTEGAMGKPYTRSRFYHLYIDGQYWGLYQTEERPEASFASSYLGGDKEDYDTVKADNDNGTIYAVDGDLTAYQTFWSEISKGMTKNEDYFRLQGLAADGVTSVPEYPKYLDVDSLIDFMLVIYYVGDRDCPLGPPGSDNRPRNLYAVFNRENPDGFQFITHDNEWSLLAGQSTSTGGRSTTSSSGLNINRVSATLGSALSQKTYFNPWWLHNRLMTDNDEYRMRFADHVYRRFFHDGVLCATECTDRFQARKNEIDLAIIAESARWGDYLTSNDPCTKDDDWLPMVNSILNNYLLATPSTRSDVVFKQIVTKGWYPTVDPPDFNQYGGRVSVGFLLTLTSDADIYYTMDGRDPRLPGGEPNPQALIYSEPIPLSRSAHILTRVYQDQVWSALADATFLVAGSVRDYLRITEIQYHPGDPSEEEIAAGFDDGDQFEFIELYNSSTTETLDLAGVQFTDGIEYEFNVDDSPQLGPHETLLLVSDRDAFAFRYGNDVTVYGEYKGNLSNGGEKIKLVDADGNTILEFEFDDQSPWPEEPDGNGPSLEIIDVNGDYNDPWNWKSSSSSKGSPGDASPAVTNIADWMQY